MAFGLCSLFFFWLGPMRCAVDKTESSEEALQGEFTWTVENFTKVKQLKLYSPVFQSGQYNWYARRLHLAVSCACEELGTAGSLRVMMPFHL